MTSEAYTVIRYIHKVGTQSVFWSLGDRLPLVICQAVSVSCANTTTNTSALHTKSTGLASPAPDVKVMGKAGVPQQGVAVLVRVHHIFTVTVSLRAKLPSRVGGGPEADAVGNLDECRNNVGSNRMPGMRMSGEARQPPAGPQFLTLHRIPTYLLSFPADNPSWTHSAVCVPSLVSHLELPSNISIRMS